MKWAMLKDQAQPGCIAGVKTIFMYYSPEPLHSWSRTGSFKPQKVSFIVYYLFATKIRNFGGKSNSTSALGRPTEGET